MSKWALAAFLILFGIFGIWTVKLPMWILPAVALFAGAAILLEGFKK